MNDNDSIEALIARNRRLEQVIALLTEHVAPRSARPPVLTMRVLRALEAAALSEGDPASTRATLRRAAAALAGEGRTGRSGASPSRPA
ncbi:hypothetical protein J2X36_003282 [Methylobacterium sp. BE186]|uniref:hypothetical protein n=1 Tax=Methylobacterium sp. BE186 TaxID=2817715 RepID=UPI002864FF52|nr:hypothetical protein [Methylobacterium sp. BE186]MDR7038516.1 hypothetical protein [Methylobacterium sp. BE186]